ncbi:hypothetical protein CAL14_19170 [Bordetella genomosp. 9]|uniref:DUF4390 domain-containing protein n=1 Tax=Bordetella genomosp. 9 TaxID=1416803 RepID=UPI000A2912C1|nr:DUF4390 domain-containing protein [Bordetella genomosp. 9]ARP92143.1 hypothetical protein CAL14_19170 [Bordetella genomosp. 9]
MPIPKRLFLLWLAAALLLPWAGRAYAADPKVLNIDPVIRDGRVEIDADIRFDLNDQLREAAERGVPLYFTADVVITRSRWWWLDSTVADTSMTWRIVYNALTRQWRAGVGELTLPVQSLDAAMDMVRHIRGWAVAEAADLSAGVRYDGRLRLRLDTSMLARPFQVNALNSSSWSVATPWKDFDFAIAEAPGDRR